MQLELSALSLPGGRPVNEDAYGIWSHQSTGAFFCVVSDGAGGHGGGDVASRLVVETVLEHFRGHPDCRERTIREAMVQANEVVLAHQADGPCVADMRATAAVMAIDVRHGRAFWGHLGDTRLYQFRDGRVLAHTRDHSVVQSMVDAGYLQPHELRTNARRSTLTAALGERDACAQIVFGGTGRLGPTDLFLICTDGLWEHIDNTDLERHLAESDGTESWLRCLDSVIRKRAKGEYDNYSAIAIRCTTS